jgi:hypothetical protein
VRTLSAVLLLRLLLHLSLLHLSLTRAQREVAVKPKLRLIE